MDAKVLDLKALTKGELRKLNALRKSLGAKIADEAFLKWLTLKTKVAPEAVDKNAELIKRSVESLIQTKKLSIPRGGYLLRRGRGRVIIERAVDETDSK